MQTLIKESMLQAFKRLDELLHEPITLIVGGGSAMILAHGFKLGTSDIDAIPRGIELAKLDPLIKQIAKEQNLAPDWLNTYYSTFAFTLPSDYGNRLISVFQGTKLNALALGKEEMLIMKCFAHRQKDVPHAKALIKNGVDITKVETHIESLKKRRIPGSETALDFLDDIRDQL